MWTAIARHLLDLLLLSMILFIAYGFGMRASAFMRVRFAHTIEAVVCAIGIGLAALANGVFIVGLLGWLNRFSVLFLLALMLLFSVALTKGDWRCTVSNERPHLPEKLLRLHSSQSMAERLMTFLCILSSSLALIGALSPPTIIEWDSLSYHLAIPKLYLKAGRIYFVQFTSHASFPFTIEMLYTVGLALSGHALAKLFHFAFFIGCAFLLLCLGNSIALQLWHSVNQSGSKTNLPSPKRSAWAASWALFTIPIALAEASTAYIDIALSFYALLFIHALIRWLSTLSFGWLVLAAIACGVCMGTKYTGVLLIIPLLCIVLLAQTRCRIKLRAPLSMMQSFTAIAIALITASPWYVKNAILTGNPFFPFFYEIFGGRGWNEKMAEQYRRHQLEFGTGRTPLQLLLAPWNLTMRSGIPSGFTRSGKKPIKYEVEPNPTSGIGLTFLAFIPTAALIRPFPTYGALLMGVCAFWFLAWFYSVQYLSLIHI
ncbi:MAG: glycosyltransferase family 39 protein, partial [Armatimonadetes bacterium]|nr:glycosyltransferase family 39 protein [Armatimonadota bacterium]